MTAIAWTGSLSSWVNRCHDGEVIEVTEPQVWTLIGVFASAMVAMFATMSGWFVRVLRAEVGGLRSEMGGLRAEMNAKFERVDAQFARVDAQFDRVDVKLLHLDRDVQALARRVFPEHD